MIIGLKVFRGVRGQSPRFGDDYVGEVTIQASVTQAALRFEDLTQADIFT